MLKLFATIFGLLTALVISGVMLPVFGLQSEVDIAQGSAASPSASCVSTNTCFSPNPMTVATGTMITWKNIDTQSHTVTSGRPDYPNPGTLFDSGLIHPGGTYQFTFTNPGTYDYFCSVHPWMKGQVTVGSTPVPEFGPVVPIVLAIAVLGIIVFFSKAKIIPRP